MYPKVHFMYSMGWRKSGLIGIIIILPFVPYSISLRYFNFMQTQQSNKELLRALSDCTELNADSLGVIRCINEKTNIPDNSIVYSFPACLGHFIHKTAMNYSLCDPKEINCLEAIGYCIPTFLRCIFGMKNYSFNCTSTS